MYIRNLASGFSGIYNVFKKVFFQKGIGSLIKEIEVSLPFFINMKPCPNKVV